MYPKVDYRNVQQGFLMPLAAFILVTMAFFAAALWRHTALTSIASTQEFITVQAFYAAESGAQAGMSQLFYNTVSPITRTSADAACGAISNPPAFNVNGLKGCSVSLSCVVATDAGNTTSFYRIRSDATCGSGGVTAQRSVEVGSFIRG